MLYRVDARGPDPAGRLSEVSSGSARVVLAVATPPRVSDPFRWGWPSWLTPTYKAGGHRSTHRTLEEYV